jgi:hypothetical protein
MSFHHLLRMAKWAKRPPSAKQVKMVIGIVLFCLILVAIERWIGVPDWVPEKMPNRPRLPR